LNSANEAAQKLFALVTGRENPTFPVFHVERNIWI
jgi:hypothetical protein